MKNFLRKIISKTGIGAPDLPTQKRFERVGRSNAPISEGTTLVLFLKADSFEVQAILETRDEDILVGVASDYALARLIMKQGPIESQITSYSSSEIIVEPNYNSRSVSRNDRADDGFV